MILDWNIATKKTQQKGSMDKQHDKRIGRAQRRPKTGNTHWFTQNNTKKNIKLENARPWWNTCFLVQEIYLHSQQTSNRNEQMPTRSTHTQMDDQRKDNIDTKGSKQRDRPKQLQTHNLSTDNVENINSTNKGRDLLLANKLWIAHWGVERMPQRIVTENSLKSQNRVLFSHVWRRGRLALDPL